VAGIRAIRDKVTRVTQLETNRVKVTRDEGTRATRVKSQINRVEHSDLGSGMGKRNEKNRNPSLKKPHKSESKSRDPNPRSEAANLTSCGRLADTRSCLASRSVTSSPPR
jgi:hypothetical protein